MIDWLTFRVSWRHPHPIEGGRVIKVDQDGRLEWECKRKLPVEGSYSSSMMVQTVDVSSDGWGSSIMIHGNPAKWFQGHNLFGGDDVRSLASAVCTRLAGLLDLPLDGLADVAAGEFAISRVDITESFSLGTDARVLAWLREAEYSAHLRHRGRGQLTGDTLYFGKHSRRWALKAYCKGHELRRKGHELPDDIPNRDKLLQYAGGLLRVELVIRGLELRRLGLSRGSSWDLDTPLRIYRAFLGGLSVSGNMPLSPAAVLELKPSVQAVYELWRRGVDVREMYPASTFYRYRRALLDVGVDIATVQRSEREGVALLEVLQARPVGIPDWAVAA